MTKGSWGQSGRGREGRGQGPSGGCGAVFTKGPGRRVVLIDSFFMHSFIQKINIGFDCMPGGTVGWEEGCISEESNRYPHVLSSRGCEQREWQIGGGTFETRGVIGSRNSL